MTLSCSCGFDTDGADWWWYQPKDEAPLATKRSRKCCSCGEKIKVGDTARKVPRYRPATRWEETRGFGAEMQLSDWYLCETCGDLFDSIYELGFCCNIGGESLKQQVEDYMKAERERKQRLSERKAA